MEYSAIKSNSKISLYMLYTEVIGLVGRYEIYLKSTNPNRYIG